MLNRSLIAITVLAITLPVTAGDFKTHNWETTYISQEMGLAINVILDVGYYIHITNQNDIEVSQFDGLLPDESPYTTYWGCNQTDIVSNFPVDIQGKASPASAAGGIWSVYFVNPAYMDPQVQYDHRVSSLSLPKGTSNTLICVLGVDVDISKLEGGTQDVVVATVDFEVVPS